MINKISLSYIGNRMIMDIRYHLFSNLQKLPLSFFHKNKSKVYVHDLAVEYDRDFNYRKKILRERKFNLNIWPRFSPTSCISVKRNYFKKCYKKINFSKFPNIWMDFRMSVYFSFISDIKTAFLLNSNFFQKIGGLEDSRLINIWNFS